MLIGVFASLSDQTIGVKTLARELEARGLESLFVGEHTHLPVASTHPILDVLPEAYKRTPAPWVLLTAAATVTDRLRVGTSVSLAAQHHPLTLAKNSATLDWLSDGRLVLGVGHGWNRVEAADHGLEPSQRGDVLVEHMHAVRALWTQEIAEFSGQHVSFGPSWAWPKPVQVPHPPVLLGAPPNERTFSRIADFADGWMPTSLYTRDLQDHVAVLNRIVESAGRDPSTLRHTMIFPKFALYEGSLESIRRELPSHGEMDELGGLGFERILVGVPLFAGSSDWLRVLDDLAKLVSANSG
jgi:probable F420-dependent oxidoreductase